MVSIDSFTRILTNHYQALIIDGLNQQSIKLEIKSGSPKWFSIDDTGSFIAYGGNQPDVHTPAKILSLGSKHKQPIGVPVFAAHFSGSDLWLLIRKGENILAERRQLETWQVIEQIPVTTLSTFEEFRILETNRPGAIIASFWGADYSGRYSAQSFYISSGSSQATLLSHFIDSPAYASPDGSGLLFMHLDRDQYQLRIRRLHYPFDSDVDETISELPNGDLTSYHGCYIDDVHFLILSQMGCLSLFHTRSMQFVAEFWIEGFEAAATSEINLNRNRNLTSLGRSGEYVVFFFGQSLRRNKPQIAMVPARDFIAAL